MTTSPDLHSALRDFHELGVARLGKVADAKELEALRERIDQIMLGEIRYEYMMMQLEPDVYPGARMSNGFKEPTLDYRKIQDLDVDPLFRAFLSKQIFRELTTSVLGDEVALYRVMFLNKPARGGSELHWHQDGADWEDPRSPWGLTIAPKVTIWTALDAATVANGCVEIVPGTHHEIIAAHGNNPTDEEVAACLADHDSMMLEAEPGEAFLFHNWTLHRSGVNATDAPRRALSVCYVEGATRQRLTDAHFPAVFPAYEPVVDDARPSLAYPSLARV